MGAKHGPNSLRNYLSIHETVMGQFDRDGFVDVSALELEPLGAGAIKMVGEIRCQGGLVCTVEKVLAVVDRTNPDDPLIQTDRYAYNVHVAGHGNLFRYDNVHKHPGHADENHRHAFDWRTGEQIGITWVGPDWPTLGEVLAEMREWYWAHSAEL